MHRATVREPPHWEFRIRSEFFSPTIIADRPPSRKVNAIRVAKVAAAMHSPDSAAGRALRPVALSDQQDCRGQQADLAGIEVRVGATEPYRLTQCV